jgi:hypothetical protein
MAATAIKGLMVAVAAISMSAFALGINMRLVLAEMLFVQQDEP